MSQPAAALDTPATTVAPFVPDPDAVEAVRQTYLRGRYLDAWEMARGIGPLATWRGPAGRVMAGRLANNLGAPRLGSTLHLRAAREHPDEPYAVYYGAMAVRSRRGALAAWQLIRRVPADHPVQRLADWQAMVAGVLALLHDADGAERAIARALELDPEHPWVHVERCSVLEELDRYPEALEAARRSLELRPWFRPGVQAAAHVLVLLDRPDEALDLLAEAGRHLQAGSVHGQRAVALLHQQKRPVEALAALDEFERLSPLLEEGGRRWLAGLRSDAAYAAGDIEGAIRHARGGGGFHQALAERLEAASRDGAAPARVELDLPFVRQHQDTCAPASIAMVCAYWKMPVDHLELAAEICYDGTPSHAERRWAEDRGWRVRDFTLTWDAARALLDRGVPFTLATVGTTTAHLQVVAGYDARRGVLLVRDPKHPGTTEFVVEPLLESHASTGPMCMALVPAAEAHRLEGIDLPDAARRDRFYALQRALVDHDRARAAALLAELEQDDPEHFIALRARISLCAYDADVAGQLACADRLLQRFPDDEPLRLWRVGLLGDLGRRDERIEALRAMSAKPADPVVWQRLACELAVDGRTHAEARHLLRRCARFRPHDPPVLATLADLLWDAGRRDEALDAYRFASCQGDKSEGYARAYFSAARALGRADEALALLRGRFARLGDRSGWPARSLCWALEELGAPDEAAAALDEARARRPDDGDLALYAADVAARRGDIARAEALLEEARPRVHAGDWRRAAAHLAANRGDPQRALALWREVVEASPLDVGAHEQVAHLLAEVEGPAAACEHLRAAAARFPHHVRLQHLWLEWLRDVDPLGAEAPLMDLLARQPNDAWARREAALLRRDQRRWDEALEHAALACELDPAHAGSWGIRGEIAHQAGRRAEAVAWLRAALERGIDLSLAIVALVECHEDPAERRDALDWVLAQALRQASSGRGLFTWRRMAHEALGLERTVELLRAARDERPDRWDAWSVLVDALAQAGRLDEARQVAEEATRRFPLRATLWLDAARVHRLAGDEVGRRRALERAAEVDPEHGAAARLLAETLQRQGELSRARALLERAAARAPLVAMNHGYLADVLWEMGEHERALERIERALRIDPGYGWAWGQLRDWSARRGDPARAERLAREIARQRPHEPRSWVRLARLIDGPGRLDEQLDALRRALEIDPRHVPAHDLQAELLAEAGRFDEALAACHPAPWTAESPPIELRGRLAWVWAEQGDLERAQAIMTEALAEAPDYAWGLRQLLGWLRRTRGPDYLPCAERLRALDPEDPVAWGYLADARLEAGDRAGAKEALHRALDLGPDYVFGGRLLLDLALEDRTVRDAERAIEALRSAGAVALAHAGAARLAALRRDRAGAVAAFEALCALPGDQAPEPDVLRPALDALVGAGWGDDAERALRVSVAQGGEAVAELFAARAGAAGRWEELEACVLATPLDARPHAAVAWLAQLADHGQNRRVRRAIREHREWLRADDRTWGITGYALHAIGDSRETAAWLADWRARQGVRPWMLANLALALRALRREAEAREVHEAAIALAPDGATTRHHAWLAVDAAAAGDADRAARHLDALPPDLEAYDAFLAAIARATLDALARGPGGRVGPVRRAFVAARLANPGYAQDPLLARAHAACVWRAARAGGGFLLGWLWRWLVLHLG